MKKIILSVLCMSAIALSGAFAEGGCGGCGGCGGGTSTSGTGTKDGGKKKEGEKSSLVCAPRC